MRKLIFPMLLGTARQRNIQRYAGMIQTKSRELKKRQEPRLLLAEIIKLAQEVQKECARFPLPY